MFTVHMTQTHAQEIQNDVISSSGGSFTDGINSIDWTMGETVIDLFSNSAKLHQGFHQVFTESLVSSNEDIFSTMNIGVFPNPTVDFIEIQSDQDLGDTYLSMVNSSGNVVLTKQLESSNNQLSLRLLPEGIYMLLLRNPSSRSVVKLIKTQN